MSPTITNKQIWFLQVVTNLNVGPWFFVKLGLKTLLLPVSRRS